MISNNLKFSIITPTYMRSTELRRAINSVLEQDYPDWEMLIINDSPDFEGYKVLESDYKDNRIRFIKNPKNLGANSSRNTGLENVATDSGWIIFLDDDDWLAPRTLSRLSGLIKEQPKERWFITNRADERKNQGTFAPKDHHSYNYAWDYLILKKIIGDATHCIDAKVATTFSFPLSIKNGEEWIYFFSLGQIIDPFYTDIDTTFTKGYSDDGLNFRKRNLVEQFKTLRLLIREGRSRKILFNLPFLFYICIRTLRAFIK